MTHYIHIRCSDEWHAWLEALASAEGRPMAELLASLAEGHAARVGHSPPPPR